MPHLYSHKQKGWQILYRLLDIYHKDVGKKERDEQTKSLRKTG